VTPITVLLGVEYPGERVDALAAARYRGAKLPTIRYGDDAQGAQRSRIAPVEGSAHALEAVAPVDGHRRHREPLARLVRRSKLEDERWRELGAADGELGFQLRRGHRRRNVDESSEGPAWPDPAEVALDGDLDARRVILLMSQEPAQQIERDLVREAERDVVAPAGARAVQHGDRVGTLGHRA